MVIELPPLRERRADIVPLFLELLAKHGGRPIPRLEPKLVERLCLGEWSMNVRELENVARRLLTLFEGQSELTLEHLAQVDDAPSASRELIQAPGRRSASVYSADEVAALLAAIERNGGNLSRAADELGITRPKAYRILRSVRPEE
jgi:two-component system NtrC family response regulator